MYYIGVKCICANLAHCSLQVLGDLCTNPFYFTVMIHYYNIRYWSQRQFQLRYITDKI